MLPNKLAFVDTETTGGSIYTDRIIEIGIIRVEEGEVVKRYQTFVNPLKVIPEYITSMTGITQADVDGAPTFASLRRELYELMADCVFVAHNARFDMSFLKQAFKVEDMTFTPRHLCTVKLAKALFPKLRHHNLDSLIETFTLACPNRHRAYDDAHVLWQFYQLIHTTFDASTIDLAIKKVMRRPTLPANLDQSVIDALPQSCGVYLLFGEKNLPLYIGKSKNIQDRVRAHFSSDMVSSTEMKIAQQVQHIEVIETASELGALIKEAALIKEQAPLYNRQLRRQSHMYALTKTINGQGYDMLSTAILNQIAPKQLPSTLMLFRSKSQAKQFLHSLSEQAGLCKKLLGIEATSGACFSYRLGLCQGACVGEEKPASFNSRLAEALYAHVIKKWPFDSPIAVIEQNAAADLCDIFLIDNWCLFGSATVKPTNQHVDRFTTTSLTRLFKDIGVKQALPAFDRDTYKILRSYFLKPSKHVRVIPLRDFYKAKEQTQDYFCSQLKPWF